MNVIMVILKIVWVHLVIMNIQEEKSNQNMFGPE